MIRFLRSKYASRDRSPHPKSTESVLRNSIGAMIEPVRRSFAILEALSRRPHGTIAALAAEAVQLAPGAQGTLDLRRLEPPEPFLRVVKRLREAPTTPLRVRIHREPFPLYDELRGLGYRYQTRPLEDGSFEILIEPGS